MPAQPIPLLDADLLLTPTERALADRVAAVAAPWREHCGHMDEHGA